MVVLLCVLTSIASISSMAHAPDNFPPGLPLPPPPPLELERGTGSGVWVTPPGATPNGPMQPKHPPPNGGKRGRVEAATVDPIDDADDVSVVVPPHARKRIRQLRWLFCPNQDAHWGLG